MQLRTATYNDAHDMAKIYVRGWHFAYTGLIDQDYLDSLSVSARAQRFQQMLEHPNNQLAPTLAILDQEVVGVCGFGRHRQLPDIAEIYSLYALPEKVGSGIGFALMNHALKHLKKQGFDRVQLWVLSGNEHAIAFYRRQGFELTGATQSDSSLGFTLHELAMERPL